MRACLKPVGAALWPSQGARLLCNFPLADDSPGDKGPTPEGQPRVLNLEAIRFECLQLDSLRLELIHATTRATITFFTSATTTRQHQHISPSVSLYIPQDILSIHLQSTSKHRTFKQNGQHYTSPRRFRIAPRISVVLHCDPRHIVCLRCFACEK